MTRSSSSTAITSEVLTDGNVRVEIAPGVATVVLDRPARRNAMTPKLWQALATVPMLLPETTQVVVIRGAGTDFCAGLDLRLVSSDGVPGEGGFLNYFADRDDEVLSQTLAEWQRAFVWLREPQWLTIAAVQGSAVGAGFQLALAADLVIATSDARFCMRETALGIVPDMTGTKGLFDRVGFARALEICASARWVDALEAEKLGIALATVTPEELDSFVCAYASRFLQTSAPAKQSLKALLLELEHRDAEAQGAAERVAQVPLLRVLVEKLRAGSWQLDRA